jgi:hypothetical protein
MLMCFDSPLQEQGHWALLLVAAESSVCGGVYMRVLIIIGYMGRSRAWLPGPLMLGHCLVGLVASAVLVSGLVGACGWPASLTQLSPRHPRLLMCL